MTPIKNFRPPTPEQADLVKILVGEDELGVVIRAHILIESQLLMLFDLLVPYPKHLKNVRLGYRQRVDFALALGLKPQYGPPLKSFGKIRNDFAHKPDTGLTEKHVKDLFGALDPKDRQVVLNCVASTNRKLGRSMNVAFRALERKDRFTLIVVALHAALLAAVMEIKREIDTT